MYGSAGRRRVLGHIRPNVRLQRHWDAQLKRARVDRRLEKTRRALLGAFSGLILRRAYDDVGVADIASLAQVSRSTFYQHFAGKDGILAASIAGPFSVLSATVGAGDNTDGLAQLLEHFWTQRDLARLLLLGPARRKTLPVLVALVEKRLIVLGFGGSGALILPRRLAAAQLAEGMLAPVTAWLMGESRCGAPVLAQAVQRVTAAALSALVRRHDAAHHHR
jgi:AcrR family transcriptional regulator